MPKFINAKKENIPKTKPKKTKAAKAKKGKEKPAKVPKAKGKNLLPKNKRVLVLLAAAVIIMIIGSAQALIVLSVKKKNGPAEKMQQAPSYYFSKDEEISSVTEIVGERDFKKPPVSDDGQEKETSNPHDKTQENKESSADAPTQADNRQEERYKYLHAEDISADLKKYKDYLEGEKHFIDVTDKSRQTGQSSTEETSETGSEIYHLAGPSKDTSSYLYIILESETDSYTVTVCKESQPWNTYYKNQWDQQKKIIAEFEKQPKASTTIEQAAETVRAQGQEKLGLPETADSYEYIPSPGISKIEGENYYAVRTYKRQTDDTLIYVASYLFDYDTGSVAFQYDETTGKTTPLN